jgi:transcriptional regulator with XRE-family HTH domain
MYIIKEKTKYILFLQEDLLILLFTNENIYLMNKRFKIWLDSVNLNANSFSKLVNLNRSTVSHIISGRNKPSIDVLEKILAIYPDLNINWLITGFGSINVKTENINKNVNKVVVFYEDSSYQELVN